MACEVFKIVNKLSPEYINDLMKIKPSTYNFRAEKTGRNPISRKRLRIKVNPDLHLTYSKNRGNLGLVLKMKNTACISILLTKHV